MSKAKIRGPRLNSDVRVAITEAVMARQRALAAAGWERVERNGGVFWLMPTEEGRRPEFSLATAWVIFKGGTR